MTSACLQHLQWDAIRDALVARLGSAAARERFAGGSDEPAGFERSMDSEVVRRRLAEVDGLEALEELAHRLDRKLTLAAELSRVEPVDELLLRARRGAELDLYELCAVADLADAARRVAEGLALADDTEALLGLDVSRRETLQILRRRLDHLDPPIALADRLHRSIDRSGEPSLADDASPALGGLRRRAGDARRSLIAGAERLLRKPGIDAALADRYWTEREGRVVLPVRSDGFSRAGGSGTVGGIIHGSSSSGQTLFVEPHGLVDDNNALREATMAVKAEEHRIMALLSAAIGEAAEALQRCLDALVDLDEIRARWRLGTDLEAFTPVVVEASPGARMRLPGARHPLMLLRGGEVVPNDLELRVGSALIVSGPNAGGKTVALKTVGICALMAQAGLRLPTSAPAKMPLFRGVVTDVGDDQSIAANLSTFSAHIGHVLEALEHADRDGSGTLVLLDEVAVGTDPDQGAALAEAIVIALSRAGASLMVTTHYERLKLLATQEPGRFVNAAVGFDIENLAPTFRVTVGTPGSSSALAVARRLGLDPAILSHAESLLSDERLRVDVLLREIEAERERLHGERRDLATERRKLEHERAALEAREARLEESAAMKHKKAHEAAAAALRALETDIKERRKAFKKHAPEADPVSGVTDADARSFARDARQQLHGTRPGGESTRSSREPAELAVGDRVRVERLGAEGEVLAIKGDKVTVQTPLAKLTVERSELGVANKPKPSAAPRVSFETSSSSVSRYFGPEAQAVEAGLQNVIDLRGVRADEALTMVEVGLDRALAEDREIVVVRHGHGTGALRKAVREHLPHLAHVRRHRPGLPAEGGDGVTVVWVRA